MMTTSEAPHALTIDDVSYTSAGQTKKQSLATLSIG
nr:MAG TPA: hypothetical protein [Caudoviricetes sp.]DAQ99404.1 MAG TPA: hypothetical protein [Caudoviricetes sp.]